MRYLTWIVLMCCLAGCGLYDDERAFEGQACDSPCGPCDLGAWDCKAKTCSVVFEGIKDDALCVGEQAEVVFVRANATGGDGSREKPLGSITQALTRQKARVILVAGAQTYEGPIVLTDGVTIEGGWSESFERDTAKRPVIQTKQTTDGHLYGVIARNLDRTTTLKLLTIQNLDANEGSNVGIYSNNAKDLRLVDLNVIAATGQSGTNGTDGFDGTAGSNGALGGVGQLWLGGDGASNASCTDASGGNGGNGERRDGNNVTEATLGSKSALGTDSALPNQDGVVGERGQIGLDGKDAEKGALDEMGFWHYPTPAVIGGDGTSGHGGGGGGGAKVDTDGTGGGGGGGGAGGCGGTGGQPGTSGWPSFGILAIDTQLRLARTTIVAGSGGDAGIGGNGGEGGLGGNGGKGAPSMVSGTIGGDGGDGGPGGRGGRGGHGQAGLSIGLYCQGSVLRSSEQSDIKGGQSGALASGERIDSQDVFQCTMP